MEGYCPEGQDSSTIEEEEEEEGGGGGEDDDDDDDTNCVWHKKKCQHRWQQFSVVGKGGDVGCCVQCISGIK